MNGGTTNGVGVSDSRCVGDAADPYSDSPELRSANESPSRLDTREEPTTVSTSDGHPGTTARPQGSVSRAGGDERHAPIRLSTDSVTETLTGRRILITGGAGFIGSHLANRLTATNDVVVVVDNFATGSAENVDSDVELVEGDITNVATLRDLADGVDILVHMAAMMGVRRTLENPLEVLEVNNGGTKAVLQIAKDCHVDRVLFASTSEVYGDLVDPPYREDDEMSPKTNYAVAKLADERYTKAFCEAAGIEYSIVRYFNVYGPRQESSEYGYVVPRFVEHATNDEVLPIHGDGSQTRDFTYIDDAVEATVRSLGPAGIDETFNIGTGVEVSITELARTVIDVVGSGETEHVEHPRPYTVTRRCADVSKLIDRLGYPPETDLERGIERLAKHL